MSRDNQKKDVPAELNTSDYVRAPGGSVRERGAKGSKERTDFAFVTSDPKMLPDPQKILCKREKKEIKGKGGEVRVAGPSLGTSKCSEVWDPPGILF